MAYGVKKKLKENGRILTVTKPSLAIAHNTSGYGEWKEKPYSVRVSGKDIKKFRTKSEAMEYLKNYRKKINKEARKIFKTF